MTICRTNYIYIPEKFARAKIGPNYLKNSSFWVIFDDFLNLWNPDKTPYPKPYAI